MEKKEREWGEAGRARVVSLKWSETKRTFNTDFQTKRRLLRIPTDLSHNPSHVSNSSQGKTATSHSRIWKRTNNRCYCYFGLASVKVTLCIWRSQCCCCCNYWSRVCGRVEADEASRQGEGKRNFFFVARICEKGKKYSHCFLFQLSIYPKPDAEILLVETHSDLATHIGIVRKHATMAYSEGQATIQSAVDKCVVLFSFIKAT